MNTRRPRPFRISLPHALRLVMRGWDLVEVPRQGCYLIAPTGHKFTVKMLHDQFFAEMIPFTQG